jgi:glycine/betaine/sarcosine/D-proline reductase family selenoprotein B
MGQEIERVGIPTVIITSLDTVARSMGCWRIVRGAGVMHVTGDPSLTPGEEVRWRRRLLERALETLEDRVSEPTIYLVEGSKEAV